MTPLQVTARLAGEVTFGAPIALDALLGFALAQRQGLEPPSAEHPPDPLDVPLARSECGRLYLASFGVCEAERHELRWTNRRFPIAEAQEMGGPRLKRIQVTAGATKSKHAPREATYLRGDRIDWWAFGEADAVRDLLVDAEHVGGRRGVGSGRVLSWDVRPVTPWEPGFPVVLAGVPLRPLPVGWPGVDESRCRVELRTLEPPYWWDRPRRQVECWVAA